MGGVKEYVRDIRKKRILTNTWFPIQEPSSKSQDSDCQILLNQIKVWLNWIELHQILNGSAKIKDIVYKTKFNIAQN
jgi:hypothetical protein